PQFSMARAAMPIFSPNCGRTSTITGWLVVSVGLPLAARPMGRSYTLAPRRSRQARLAAHEHQQRDRHHGGHRQHAEIVEIGDGRGLAVELLAPHADQLVGIV